MHTLGKYTDTGDIFYPIQLWAANQVKADAILYADKAVAIGAEVIAVGAAGHFLYAV